ncbi:Hypothetical predicted protein, partial [Pelobates cultripes]
DFPKPIKKLIYIILGTVSILIARKWKTADLPSIREVETEVTLAMEYELIMWKQAKIGKLSPYTATIWRNYTQQLTQHQHSH